MPQIRIDIPQSLVDELNDQLRRINKDPQKKVSANDMAREALSIYKWVVDNKSRGKSVVVTDSEHNHFRSFISPNIPE